MVMQLAMAAGTASATVLCVASDHAAVETSHASGLCEVGRGRSGPLELPPALGTLAPECTDTPLFVQTLSVSSERGELRPPPSVFIPTPAPSLTRVAARLLAADAPLHPRQLARALSSVILLV